MKIQRRNFSFSRGRCRSPGSVARRLRATLSDWPVRVIVGFPGGAADIVA